MGRTQAYVALGANVGDPRRTLTAAVSSLAALPETRLTGVSRLYATRPVGVTDQPEFRNAAVALDVPSGEDRVTGALALLIALKGIERAFGRQERERWGPRELDLDLLLFDDLVATVERPEAARSIDPEKTGVQWLTVPHASLAERLFMLAPLADIARDRVVPGTGRTVAELAEERAAIEGTDAVEAIAAWDGGGWTPFEEPRN
jgi:2-amino-4-hydroxy-6-hydroxymethyldihydropteridine diphosphokinase